MPGMRALLCGLSLLAGLAACRTAPPPAGPAPSAADLQHAPVRFVLTFDDGPSGAERDNPTARILDTLARNRWQNGLKAVFFVQTRHPRHGGSVIGQDLMRRMHAEGHVLGLHTASPAGHILHTRLTPDELDRMLDNGIADIHRVSGDVPHFLRPPNWVHNARTVARYQAHGLSLIMTDLRIKDGKTAGFNSSPGARRKFNADLQRAAHRIAAGELPRVAGHVPLIVTLHDPNPSTARDLESYLGMLVEEARAVGLTVDHPPFSASLRELVLVTRSRAVRPPPAAAVGVPVYR